MDDTKTSSTNSSLSTDKFRKMKCTIDLIKLYLGTNSESSLIKINQLLQGLSVTTDISQFDPNTNLANEFFITLHDLMNGLEPKSHTSWHCVNLLINICKNPNARKEIANTHHFLPCLAKMVDNNLTNGKKSILLILIDNITCGIEFHKQIPHLSHLLSTISKWIEDKDLQIVTLTLGVILNLCYKNPSTISVLQRHIDLKNFIRTCLTLEGAIVEVYVCHMSIIVENVSGYIPNHIWPKLIENTFTAIIQAYHENQLVLLKLIHFFIDRMDNNYHLLKSYNSYKEKIREILDMIHNDINGTDKDPEAVGAIFDFLHFFIEAKVPEINFLYTSIVNLALKWIDVPTVSYKALITLKSIGNTLNKSEQKDIIQSLKIAMPNFLSLLQTYQNECSNLSIESVNRLEALLRLLTELLAFEETRKEIVEHLEEEVFNRIFFPLIGDDAPKTNENVCNIYTVNMYIYGLYFLEQLIKYNSNWLKFVNDLLMNRQIHVILARAISFSPSNVKKIALILSSKSAAEAVAIVLSNLQSESKTEKKDINTSSFNHNSIELNVYSSHQYERVQNALDKIENLISTRELNSSEISDLMELYNYNLSYKTQTEMSALASLESINKHCTNLQHSVKSLTNDQLQLQQSKLFLTRNLEESLRKREELHTNLKNIQSRLDEEKVKSKQYNSQLKSVTKTLVNIQDQLKDQESKLISVTKEKNDLDEQLASYKLLNEKVAKNFCASEQKLKKTEELLESANGKVEKYNKEIEQLKISLGDTEKKLEECQIMLERKSAILENITSLATTRL